MGDDLWTENNIKVAVLILAIILLVGFMCGCMIWKTPDRMYGDGRIIQKVSQRTDMGYDKNGQRYSEGDYGYLASNEYGRTATNNSSYNDEWINYIAPQFNRTLPLEDVIDRTRTERFSLAEIGQAYNELKPKIERFTDSEAQALGFPDAATLRGAQVSAKWAKSDMAQRYSDMWSEGAQYGRKFNVDPANPLSWERDSWNMGGIDNAGSINPYTTKADDFYQYGLMPRMPAPSGVKDRMSTISMVERCVVPETGFSRLSDNINKVEMGNYSGSNLNNMFGGESYAMPSHYNDAQCPDEVRELEQDNDKKKLTERLVSGNFSDMWSDYAQKALSGKYQTGWDEQMRYHPRYVATDSVPMACGY
jgi:hypothetical protein